MKALFKAKPEFDGLEMRDIPIPEPKANEVLIKMKAASICGTDYHIYKWDEWSQNRVKPPTIIGHEFSGDIVKIGAGVTHFAVGDFVSGEGHLYCGYCKMCRTGQGHVCENWVGLGYDVDGCFAEYMVLPDRNVWKNNPKLSPAVCAVQDPLGNAVHSVFATDCVGKTVAVFGMGPVGLLSVAVLKSIGAKKIIAVEKGNHYRMELARQVGATHVIDVDNEPDVLGAVRAFGGVKGVDVSMEMAGAQSSIINSIECVRPNGHAVLLGIPNGSVPFKVTEDIIFKSLHIHGITGRAIWDTWYRMAALLESGHLDLSPIITHSFPFTEYQKGFDIMESGKCGKVILTFD